MLCRGLSLICGDTPFFKENSLPLTISHFFTCAKSFFPLLFVCLFREMKYMNQQGVHNSQTEIRVSVLVELKDRVWLQKEKGMDNSRSRSWLVATGSDSGGKKHSDQKRSSFKRFKIHLRREPRRRAWELLNLPSPDHFLVWHSVHPSWSPCLNLGTVLKRGVRQGR